MFNFIKHLLNLLIDNLIDNAPIKKGWVQSDLELEYRRLQANFNANKRLTDLF